MDAHSSDPASEPGPAKSVTRALRTAEDMGLFSGPKTKHFTVKVSPRLFEAAAKRAGSTSPAVVVTAALASLATEDTFGPWLASQWGVLADIDSEVLGLMEF